MHSKIKIFIAFLAVALVLLGWFVFSNVFNEPVTQPPIEEVVAKNDSVLVTKTDITQNGASKLPQGFPQGIPVEVVTVTESYKVAYSRVNAIQYTVSYTSKKSKDDLWTLYADYMNSSGYTIDKQASSRSLGQISGTKNGDTLSAIISAHNSATLVQLNFLDRQQ